MSIISMDVNMDLEYAVIVSVDNGNGNNDRHAIKRTKGRVKWLYNTISTFAPLYIVIVTVLFLVNFPSVQKNWKLAVRYSKYIIQLLF